MIVDRCQIGKCTHGMTSACCECGRRACPKFHQTRREGRIYCTMCKPSLSENKAKNRRLRKIAKG